MKYTYEDLELAQHWSALHAYDHPDALAELLTRVRRETREECLSAVTGWDDARDCVEAVRALLTPPCEGRGE